jgi:ABC-2 type transport system ATP-binding protein
MALVTSEPAAAGSSPAALAAPTAVHLDHVRRGFGDKPALVDLSIDAATGTITVLLGPNGAGKTTAVRMITGALSPEAGAVRVFGLDPSIDGEEVRRRCGVVAAKPALYDRLSGYDNLAYSAALYGVSNAAIGPAAERFGIAEALRRQVGGYSTGMKTRLALARSVLHDPELLLYDEPTSGLDPESSFAVLELIHEMAAEGRTVIMCTHLLLEAEGLADQVVVLEGGRDVIAGPPAELTRRYWPDTIVRIAATEPAALVALRGRPGVLGVDLEDDGRAVVRLDDIARVPDLVAVLVAEGTRVTRVEPFTPTLEDLYFAVRGMRQ